MNATRRNRRNTHNPTDAPAWKPWRRLAWAGAACGLMALGAAGCATTQATIPVVGLKVPLPDISFLPIPFLQRGDGDLRKEGWLEAFDRMHRQMEREYPFTDWKDLDWNALYAEYAPLVKEAEEAGDRDAYYLALRGYMYSAPDGNMRISDDDRLKDAAVGAGFGLGLRRTEDNRYIAAVVMEDGPADRAGMEWGAEVLAWNGQPIAEAVRATPTLWATYPPATTLGRHAVQVRLLTRAPEGAEAAVRFLNPGSETPWVGTLIAEEDAYRTTRRTLPFSADAEGLESPIQWEVLESGHGYLKVFAQSATLTTPFPARAFRRAVLHFSDHGVPGLIIDLRANAGGPMELATEFLGHFHEEETVCGQVAVYNKPTDSFEVVPDSELIITPREPFYRGPIAVLVGPRTINSGEAMAWALGQLGHVRLIGFGGTHGSLGVLGGDIAMPGEITLSYPVGRLVDRTGSVLVDSNGQGEGGAEPGLRVPVTQDHLRAIYVEGKDVALLEAQKYLDEWIAAHAHEMESGAPEEKKSPGSI